MLQDILQVDFLRYAFLSGIMIGIICPVIGVFIVLRKMSLMADGMSHMALSGIAAGLALQRYLPFLYFINPFYIGMLFSVLGSFCIRPLMKLYPFYREFVIPIILASAIGLSVVFISLADAFNKDLFGYLFGSLITISHTDFLVVLIVLVIVLGFVILCYKPLLILTFDEEGSLVSKRGKQVTDILFTMIVALVVSVTMNIVGVLLVSAMMIIPVAKGMQLAKSFKQVFIYSIIFAEFDIIGGLVVSYQFNWSTGGTIVVLAFVLFMIVLLIKKTVQSISRSKPVSYSSDETVKF
ncbi:zinc transport system permease protein [Scopulibacillus daqui]|uniref:Zinc transport system permease protein n=1 Tax=Scopulibacillus daqui TaxID=1469162 RepID=A0ABS2PX41_9BACL|nr:metal ABC transporter permease [Scopulibacillus daqui]MBM7644130.1 zinc transport system permease protein [Scopulibacillus daqui]